jgi:MOSC domain-containing protein YiiM
MYSYIKAISISARKGTKKDNVDSAYLIEDFGIKNDAHGGGERQLSLLAYESIEKMKKLNLCVSPGSFGENITTEHIDLIKLKINTRLKLGNEVIIEITKIGKDCLTPCYIYKSVGDCVMPKEGVFAKIIRSGAIKKRDKIEIIS